MKTQLFKSPGLGLLLASLLAALPALAQTTQPTTPAPAAPVVIVGKNVSGKVDAKTDTTLTVGGRLVSISSSTTFSKAGASIGSGDIKVGNKVNIVTSEDGQVAVSVDVISTE